MSGLDAMAWNVPFGSPKQGQNSPGPRSKRSQKNVRSSLNIKVKYIKLYIFEISIKFRVDWYTIYPRLKKPKFG